AWPCRAVLHPPGVLATRRSRLARQAPPQRVHHRVDVLVGAEVTELGGQIQIAREEPRPLGLEQRDVIGRVARGVDDLESKTRGLEPLAERRRSRRRPGTPGDAAVQL